MGMKLTFTCAACHRESPTTGRKAARYLGLRTFVCGPCKTAMHCKKGPKPMPLRELLLGKIGRADGIQPAMLFGRIAEERRELARDEVDKLIGEGLVFLMQRHAGNGSPSKRLFTDKAKAVSWQQQADPRMLGKSKLATVVQGLAPLHPQTAGKAWRSLTPPVERKVVAPKGLKTQVLPSAPAYDARYQCDPKERVIGGFASMGIGRYLDGAA